MTVPLQSAMAVLERLLPVAATHHEFQDELAEWVLATPSQVTAHSAASSLALLRFLPSYQYLASTVLPWTMTRLDHAVRPPKARHRSVSWAGSLLWTSRPDGAYRVGPKRVGRRAAVAWLDGKLLSHHVSVKRLSGH